MQKSESLIKITGKVLYIKYHNEDNGYTVFCVEKDAYEAVNVVGYCYGIQQGDSEADAQDFSGADEEDIDF